MKLKTEKIEKLFEQIDKASSKEIIKLRLTEAFFPYLLLERKSYDDFINSAGIAYSQLDDYHRSNLKKILRADPTSTENAVGKYANWLAELFTWDKISINSISEITETLKKFVSVNKQLPPTERNIAHYADLQTLQIFLSKFESKKGLEKQKKEIVKSGLGWKELANDKMWRVLEVTTYEAWKYWGVRDWQETPTIGLKKAPNGALVSDMPNWCTLVNTGYWNEYTNDSTIPKLMLLNKLSPEKKHNDLSFNFGTGFVDFRDNPINYQAQKDLYEKYVSPFYDKTEARNWKETISARLNLDEEEEGELNEIELPFIVNLRMLSNFGADAYALYEAIEPGLVDGYYQLPNSFNPVLFAPEAEVFAPESKELFDMGSSTTETDYEYMKKTFLHIKGNKQKLLAKQPKKVDFIITAKAPLLITYNFKTDRAMLNVETTIDNLINTIITAQETYSYNFDFVLPKHFFSSLSKYKKQMFTQTKKNKMFNISIPYKGKYTKGVCEFRCEFTKEIDRQTAYPMEILAETSYSMSATEKVRKGLIICDTPAYGQPPKMLKISGDIIR